MVDESTCLNRNRVSFILNLPGRFHTQGGTRFKVDSDEAKTILRWIAAGAPFSPDEPRLQKLEIEPKEATFSAVNETKQLKVLAHFTDGSIKDVTHQAVYESKDEPVAHVSPSGLVKSVRWGWHWYLGKIF